MPYFNSIIRFLHDDIFMSLYSYMYKVVPHALAASAAAVAGVFCFIWLCFRLVVYMMMWIKGEKRGT